MQIKYKPITEPLKIISSIMLNSLKSTLKNVQPRFFPIAVRPKCWVWISCFNGNVCWPGFLSVVKHLWIPITDPFLYFPFISHGFLVQLLTFLGVSHTAVWLEVSWFHNDVRTNHNGPSKSTSTYVLKVDTLLGFLINELLPFKFDKQKTYILSIGLTCKQHSPWSKLVLLQSAKQQCCQLNGS